MDWSSLVIGQRACLVLTLICLDPAGGWHLAQSHDRRGVKVWVKGELPHVATVAGVDLQVTSVVPVQLEVDATTFLVPVPPCARPDLYRVVDLCAGMGGFSYAAAKAGFKVCAGVDHNGMWRKLYETLHEGAVFCCGDLLDSAVLQQLLRLGLFHGVVCAGIACQPHSILGDRKGMADPRAQSLPRALLVAWLLQSAVLILECTPEILRDSQAQEILRQFTVATGFRMTQAILKLSNSWCSRRDRWIAVLTAPVVPICELLDMPQCSQIQVVRDLIPSFEPWPQFEQAQIVLNLYELSKYYQYAAGGMSGVFLKDHEKLPTLLHSAGNQLYTCACGCRAALSEARLRQKGLIGVLVPLGTSQVHMNTCMYHARYLHPLEMWALLGGIPEVNMGHNLRLAMAGVGQCVAPLMGHWIFAQVHKCLNLALDLPPCDPMAMFQAYMHEVIQACRLRWPIPAQVSAVAPTLDDPIEDDEPMVARSLVTVTWPGTDAHDVQIRVSPNSTGLDLLTAERRLGVLDTEAQLRMEGEHMDLNTVLPHMSLVSVVPPTWDPAELRTKQVVPCCLDIEGFLQFVRASDASVPGPVTSLSGLSVIRHPEMAQVERLSILAVQGPVWGDDEILFGLERIATDTAEDQHVTVWDPLLISGLVQADDPTTWTSLANRLGPVCTVVSAVVLGGHWIPLVWRVDAVGAKLHTVSVTTECESVMERLARVFDVCRGGAQGVWQPHSLGFTPDGFCGALALAFVRHLLWGWTMIADQEDLCLTSQSLRIEFGNKLGDPCVRPLLAGLGLSLQSRLADVLVQHGVSAGESNGRAAATLKALGEGGVTTALASDNPWRELKWLGNQLRPPYMLIKPSELQMQIERRAQDKPVGNKRHKQHRPTKGKGKGMPVKPVAVDPASLRLEHGIFQSASDQSLAQLGLSQVGPHMAGVVVLSAQAAEPYLKAANPISSGPLAFFVVDAQAPLVTHFDVTAARVPLVCAVNSEPLLVDGHLVQLGAVGVQRAPIQQGCEVKAIPTCVVKAMIYRDQTTVPWSEVVAHPLLHIFSQVPPLQSCQDEDCCGCESWHSSVDFPMPTPVLELWGKQWLRLDFRSSPPDQSELFTAHLRLPEHLQLQVQHFSGHAGVYLEPKAIDGRQPSPDFQVVWMPKADQSQLLLQRQTVQHVVGLARMGNKMGLRCRSEHAASIFSTLRPGHTFLPPGKRQSFLVGPFAYGTLQSSVAQVLHSNGWTAKPVQAVAAKAHVQGLMFRVQSVQDPPCKVICMSHGDVMIAKEEDQVAQERPTPKVVATSATESMVAKAVEADYIQLNDPWAKAAGRLASGPKAVPVPIGNPLEDMAQKVLQEVMAQLPKSAMEVDSDNVTDKRVAALETQVQELHDQTKSLAEASQLGAQETAAQFQDLRGQIHQQGVHFEQAISAQATSLQGFHDSFQEQLRQQVCHQQSMLDNMFSKQMVQFENLLSKRPRQE